MTRPRIRLEDALADPVAAFARARSEGWLADLDFALGVLTHQDARTLLADRRLRASFPDVLRALGITSGPFYEWMAMSPLNRDGEDHRRWRSVMSRAFTPRSVERIEPFLRGAADELIDGFADRGRCEFVAEFADAYPSLGLCELIGVPHEDRDRFRGWANTIGLGFNPILLPTCIAEVDDALTHLLAYTAELAARRRADPRDDLLTRMATAGAEDGWTDAGVHGAIAGLVFAGHETTKNQLGWMVASLAERPDVWDAVAEGSLPCAAVVEEVLRHRSAVSGVGRVVDEPLEHRGEQLRGGDRVFLSIWSANHDESAYACPERIDVERNADVPHLAFGLGAHHCLGAALARAELRAALDGLTKRIGCPKVGEGAAWKPFAGISGPDCLPITFRARAPGAAVARARAAV
jgi:cytochrome P450